MARMALFALVIPMMASCSPVRHIGLSDEARVLEPDEAFRARLAALVKEVTPPLSRTDEAAVREYYDELLAKSGVPPEEFVLKMMSLARGNVADMELVGPIQAAVAKLPPEAVLRTVGPYAATKKHKEDVWNAVSTSVATHKLRTPERCAEVLVGYGGDIPRGLMDVFFYLLTPHDAAVMCAAVFAGSQRDRRGSLKLVDSVAPYVDWNAVRLSGDAMAELRERLPALIASKHWWVRRYAADVIYRFDGLHQPELVQPLLRDPESLVSKQLKAKEQDMRGLR